MKLKSAISSEDIDFIVQSPLSTSVYALAHRIAKYQVPVLITGETGTGKECVAKYIHSHSENNKAPYIGINCAAIPETMLEAMLFGYEKGAFTGAVVAQAGKFELANGGTLLLDEIADMPLTLQAKLLRVIQEQEVERLGSHKKIPLNLRLIASTNKNLEAEIAKGQFREDLYYRLAVVPVHIAPLRERIEDILPLAQHFIHYYSPVGEQPVLSVKAQQALMTYNWPGNIRELENAIRRGIIMSNDGVINVDNLGLDISHNDMSSTAIATEENTNILKQQGRVAQYQYLVNLLQQHDGNRVKTAKFLGITPRALRYRLASMRKFGMNITV